MNVGERIKKRRKELKYSADYVADKLGKNRATVYRYESDDIENMPIDVVKDLSVVLETSPAYLMGWSDLKEDLDTNHEYLYFDTSISAGIPDQIDAISEKDVNRLKIPDALMGKWAGHNDIFITKINGDSMNNVIPDNSLIAVKQVELSQLKNNDIVVYKYDSEYAVKRFINHENKLIFRPDSDNPTFTDLVINIDNDCDVFIKGKVILYIINLD